VDRFTAEKSKLSHGGHKVWYLSKRLQGGARGGGYGGHHLQKGSGGEHTVKEEKLNRFGLV